MRPTRRYTLPGTDLHVRIATHHPGDGVDTLAENYGLVSSAGPVKTPTAAGITITTCEPPGLPEELALLSPLEAILCEQHIYVSDSRLSLGPPIRVESGPAAALPRIGLDVALTLCFAQQGAVTLHACGFRFQDTDFLAFGPSQAGKSTLAAAVLASGGQILTDDQLLCHMDQGTLHARWLRKDMLLRQGGMDVLTDALRQQAIPLRINGETRWQLDRRRHPAGFVDSLTPSTLLFLHPPDLSRATPVATPIDHAIAYSELVRSSSPALFGQSAVTITALTRTCRDLLAVTKAFRLTASPQLITNPQRELRLLMNAVGLSPPR